MEYRRLYGEQTITNIYPSKAEATYYNRTTAILIQNKFASNSEYKIYEISTNFNKYLTCVLGKYS